MTKIIYFYNIPSGHFNILANISRTGFLAGEVRFNNLFTSNSSASLTLCSLFMSELNSDSFLIMASVFVESKLKQVFLGKKVFPDSGIKHIICARDIVYYRYYMRNTNQPFLFPYMTTCNRIVIMVTYSMFINKLSLCKFPNLILQCPFVVKKAHISLPQ